MSTRLKKPSILKQLALSAVLIAFLTYLGFNAVGGQFGLEGQREMLDEIDLLSAEAATLQAEVDALTHRISLFDPKRLDPDILTERARALLSMANANDRIMLDLDYAISEPPVNRNR